MRSQRIRAELELVRQHHGEPQTDEDLTWMLFPVWSLPPGWNRAATPLAILLPPAYPTTPPDNFYVAADLRTAANSMPGNASEVNGGGGHPPGTKWLMFSWHVEANWLPGAEVSLGDNLLTFLASIGQRLAEVS